MERMTLRQVCDEIRFIGRDVIPDGRKAADRESISDICLRERLWIPGQPCGLPGMTAVTVFRGSHTRDEFGA